MLRLNDDCLRYIFLWCNMKQQLILSSVCERFRDVIVGLIWYREYKKLSTTDEKTNNLTADEYQRFFALNISNLEELTIYNTRKWAFTSYLGRFYRPELAFYFTFSYPHLVELTCEDPDLQDAIVRLMVKKCPKLRVLHLKSVYVTGAYIKDIRKLQKLYLLESSLKMEHLKDILSTLQLTNLAITNQNAKVNLGRALAELEPIGLKELQISESAINEEFISNFQKLYNLKVLIVSDITFDIPSWSQLMQVLDKRIYCLHICECGMTSNRAKGFYAPTTLEELHFEGLSFLAATLKLIKNSPELKHIYLDSYLVLDGVMGECDQLDTHLKQQSPLRTVLSVHIASLEQHPIFEREYEFLKILKMDPKHMVRFTVPGASMTVWVLRFQL